MKVKTITLSICPCGFPGLKDEIPLGTEYEIDPRPRGGYIFTCGGCHKSYAITAVDVRARGDSHGGMLPARLFFEHGKVELLNEAEITKAKEG